MSTVNAPVTITPLEPVADDKNLLAPVEGASCCGGSNCCG